MTNSRLTFQSIAIVTALLFAAGLAVRADAANIMLPQEHEYQKVLRNYMATLTEADFEHGVTEHLTTDAQSSDVETQFRNYAMTQMLQPLVGFKRGTPAVVAPAWLFVLSTIEGPEVAPTRDEIIEGFEQKAGHAVIRPGPIPVPTGIVVPPVWPDALTAFADWDYPGNVYYGNRALKMRAFVAASVRLIMIDHHLGDLKSPGRSDWNAYKLVTFCSTYMSVKDLLPPEVQAAYREGVARLASRILYWGDKGEEPNFDMITPIGLWYASQICDDPELTRQAEVVARRMMTDPDIFHPAGYWVERGGGLDVGFGGMTNFFAVFTALASEWDFAHDAVAKAYRLRAHLTLPEPDGSVTGPSAFNSRIGTAASEDQWHWDGARDLAAAMVTDEAAYAIKLPDADQLAAAGGRRAEMYNGHIYGNLRNPYNPVGNKYGYIRDEDARGRTWSWRIWDTYNFPATVNPGYSFYRKGAYARLKKLADDDSPMFKLPYLRGDSFVRNFGDAFVSTRQPTYGAIVHSGPVGWQDPDDGLIQFKGPLGFGGGQLSAFWTPEAGSVLLARRSGMDYNKTRDDIENWRNWPLHAVTGITAEGRLFTSGRLLKPEVQVDVDGDRKIVTAAGPLPAASMDFADPAAVLAGQIDYRREFEIKVDSVHVKTTIGGDGKDAVAELYETLPVYLRDTRAQAKLKPTTIEFQIDGSWVAGSSVNHENVTAVRLTRFKGAVEIRFDSPQRVKLSPAVWTDAYISRGSCQAILIDMLGAHDGPAKITGERTVGYSIQAIAPAN